MQQIFYYCVVLLIGASMCQDADETCKWIYKCCKFKEENGVTSCEEMCDAVIKCESTTENILSNEVESFNATSDDKKSDKFLYSFRRRMPVPMCKSGYKYRNGQCRRVLRIVNDEDNENKDKK